MERIITLNTVVQCHFRAVRSQILKKLAAMLAKHQEEIPFGRSFYPSKPCIVLYRTVLGEIYFSLRN